MGGYTGQFCTDDVNECFVGQNPCVNGLCVNTVGGVTCDCTNTGFTGDFCQTQSNFCLNNNCANNAVCVEGFNSYTCNCANTGYTGQFCTDDVNECFSGQNPCVRGQCINSIGSVSCDCSNTGYTGQF